MATFPRYQSKGELTTQQPSVQAQTDNTGSAIAEAGSQIGGAITEAAVKWSNAVDTVQKTTAMANFRTGMLDIENRAQNDPNYNNSDQYFQEIEKLKASSLKGFSNKQTENEMAAEFGYHAKVGQIQIDNLYKKKIIDVGQTSSLQLIDTEVNNPTDQSLENIKAELNAQVAAGIFDHKAAYQLISKANQDLGVNRVNKDLYQAQTPEQIDAITQGLTSGAYEKGGVTIEPDKKKNLLDVADRARINIDKKLQAQAVEAQTSNRMETLMGIASNKTPLETLDITSISEYDPQLAGALTKTKDFMVNYNPKLPVKEQGLAAAGLSTPSEYMKMKNYAKSITDVFMQDDNQQLSDFVLRELEKKGDGLTPSVKIAAFVNLAALKAKVNNQQTAPDVESSIRFDAIKSGIRFLQNASPYLSPITIGEFVVKNYLSGSSSEKKVMEEAKSVLKNKLINRYPSIAKLPSMPNKIVDGEASVEDLQSGENDLTDGQNGNYGDQSGD